LKLQIGINGKTYEVEVEVTEDDSAPRPPAFGSYPQVPATVHSTAAPSQTAQPPAAEENAAEANLCRSPVAGLVIKVNVEVGQAIEADELLLVLEAMKMETNVTAGRAGKVKNVRVAQGDAVKVNQVVVEFE
jgi:methylmalonyl-CoA carboxyltransferase small subunit